MKPTGHVQTTSPLTPGDAGASTFEPRQTSRTPDELPVASTAPPTSPDRETVPRKRTASPSQKPRHGDASGSRLLRKGGVVPVRVKGLDEPALLPPPTMRFDAGEAWSDLAKPAVTAALSRYLDDETIDVKMQAQPGGSILYSAELPPQADARARTDLRFHVFDGRVFHVSVKTGDGPGASIENAAARPPPVTASASEAVGAPFVGVSLGAAGTSTIGKPFGAKAVATGIRDGNGPFTDVDGKSMGWTIKPLTAFDVIDAQGNGRAANIATDGTIACNTLELLGPGLAGVTSVRVPNDDAGHSGFEVAKGPEKAWFHLDAANEIVACQTFDRAGRARERYVLRQAGATGRALMRAARGTSSSVPGSSEVEPVRTAPT